ncbi:MAG: hypothetical protein ABNH21_14230 [Glaciecola sp.]
MFSRRFILAILPIYIIGCGGNSEQAPTMNETPPPPPFELEAPRVSHLSPFNTVEADILVMDGIVFIADGINPLRGFELPNGMLNEISITGEGAFGTTRLAQRENLIIAKGGALTSTGGQLRFYDAQDIASISQIGDSPDFIGAGGLHIVDDLLLTGGTLGDGISSYRLTNPSTIEFIGNEPVDGPISDIDSINNVIFAISQSNILIYTISNDGSLIFSGSYPVTVSAYKADLADNMLFYSDDNRAKVLDLSNPLVPVQLFETPDKIENRQIIPVKYYQNHMFVGGLKTVEIFKNTDGMFKKIGTIETENEVTEINFIESYMIVINSSRAVSEAVPEAGPSSIEVFDISSLF